MAHADNKNYYEIVNHSESNKKTEQNNKTKPKQLKFHERKPIETGTNKTPNDYKYYSNTTRKFSSNNKDVNNETDSDFENQVEPAYVKVSKIERNNLRNKENHIVLEYSDETDHCLSRQSSEKDNPELLRKKLAKHNHTLPSQRKLPKSNHVKAINKSLDNINYKNGNILNENATRATNLPFNEDISKNLERMLNKMQKSFDPFKLRDDNLKFSIIKEILECQRLLLTVNLSNNVNNSSNKALNGDCTGNLVDSKKGDDLTLNEIYDEWKILAMIVDRICFFFYLLAMVFSSGIFFLREQIYDDKP